jgi:hypothetical protein
MSGLAGKGLDMTNPGCDASPPPSRDGPGRSARTSTVRLLTSWPVLILAAMAVGLVTAKWFGTDGNIPGVLLLAMLSLAIVGVFAVGIYVYVRDQGKPPYD